MFDYKKSKHRQSRLQEGEHRADGGKRDIVFETVEEALVNQKNPSRKEKIF